MNRTTAATSMNWAELHRRLREVRAALEQSAAPDPHRSRRVLRERALRLARRPAASETGDCLDVVVFRVCGETYAVETVYIAEAVPLSGLTPLPGAPPHLMGIIHVRGQIVSVLDLRHLLGLSQKRPDTFRHVLVLGAHEAEFGVAATDIEGIRRVPNRRWHQAPPTLPPSLQGRVQSVTADGLILLAGRGFLEDEQLRVDETVET